jgi:2,4-dienoyl-CoA reductase (NADPH2)
MVRAASWLVLRQVGQRVAIIGAGGIGFDVAEFLIHDPSHKPASVDVEKFLAEWGIDGANAERGGLRKEGEEPVKPARELWLLQRKKGKLGAGLGKTTGWIHRASLKKGGVHMLGGVEYVKVDDQGLHVKVKGEPRVLEVDNVVICAGQEPLRELEEPLQKAGVPLFRNGGAELAAELDAKRAIDQGTRLAAAFETTKPGTVLTAPVSFEAKVLKVLGVGM